MQGFWRGKPCPYKNDLPAFFINKTGSPIKFVWNTYRRIRVGLARCTGIVLDTDLSMTPSTHVRFPNPVLCPKTV